MTSLPLIPLGMPGGGRMYRIQKELHIPHSPAARHACPASVEFTETTQKEALHTKEKSSNARRKGNKGAVSG